MEKLLTVEEVSKLLSMSKISVRRLYYNGRIPAIKISERIVRFKKVDIDNFIEECNSDSAN